MIGQVKTSAHQDDQKLCGIGSEVDGKPSINWNIMASQRSWKCDAYRGAWVDSNLENKADWLWRRVNNLEHDIAFFVIKYVRQQALGQVSRESRKTRGWMRAGEGR